MSNEHTQGRLVVRGGYSLHAADTGMPVGDACITNTPRDLSEANARRLAACWNVCQGIDTADLERLPAMVNQTLPYHQLRDQRGELLDALHRLHQALTLTLAGRDGKQHANPETRAGRFIHMVALMRNAERAISNAKVGL